MARRYDLGGAYIQIMPSMEGMAAAISKELGKAVREAPVEEPLKEKLGKAAKSVDLSGVAAGMFKNASAIVAPLNGALKSVVGASGKLFANTITAGAKTAGLALSTAVAAVGTQTLAGGFNRALGINQATAGLKAMGYEGQKFTAIMDAAGKSVDGTAYSMDQSVLAARNFLAAGVPEAKLQGYLENVGKLADMGTRTYDDISVMLQSMAATGVVQGGDMLQLAQAGIPIFTALAETLGTSVAEVKKLGSEGKISFADLNRAIESVKWDSAIYAATDVRSAFGNVRAQLSKIGANLWSPIIDKLPPILNDVRSFISIFGKTFDFNPIQVRLSASMDKIASTFARFKNAQGELDPKLVKQYVTEVVGGFSELSTKLEAYKPVIVGALIGISGSFLSSIPIIGPAFAGITPVVGAFAGVLVAAYKNSESLRGAIKGLSNLWNTVSGKLFSKVDFKPDDFFKGIGDGLAKGVVWIQGFITDFIEKLSENLPAITASIDSMFTGIGEAFSKASDSGFNGAALADVFTSIIEIFGTYAPLAISVVLEASAGIASIISSDFMQGFIGWISTVMGSVAENEGIIKAGLAAGAAIFIGSKLIPVFKGIMTVAAFFKTASPTVEAAAKVAPAMAGSFKGLLLATGKILLVVAAVVAAMAAVGYLMENTGFMDYVNVFIEEIFGGLELIGAGLSNVVVSLLPAISGYMGVITDTITNLAGGVAEAIATIIDSTGGLVGSIGGLFDTVDNLLNTLADKGMSAGAAALVAASGITALMAAVSGGALLSSGAGALSWLAGGQDNPIGQLETIVNSVTQLSALTETVPVAFTETLALATAFGLRLAPTIAEGLQGSAPVLGMALSMALSTALQEQQTYLDANPLIVRVDVDTNNLQAIEAATSRVGNLSSGSTYNRNSTYNVRTSNDSIIKQLINDARGR